MKGKFWEEDATLFDIEPKIQWMWRRTMIGTAEAVNLDGGGSITMAVRSGS